MHYRSTLTAVALALTVVLSTPVRGQESHFVIPAAGDLPGQNDTHFRSDITILNLRDMEQRITIEWLPAGTSGSGIAPTIATLAPNGVLTSENFVGEILSQQGLGAVLIRAVDSANAHDAAGRLYATSRIWTPQPGSEGTTSQTMPAVPFSQVVHEHVVFAGHRIDGRYRVNAGVVNVDRDTEQTFVFNVTGSIQTIDPMTIFVPVKPFSMAQVRVDWPDDPVLRIDVEVLPQAGGGKGTLWVPYVSSVDNVTGDSWSTLGVEVSED